MKEIMQKKLLQEIDLLHETLGKKNKTIEELKLVEDLPKLVNLLGEKNRMLSAMSQELESIKEPNRKRVPDESLDNSPENKKYKEESGEGNQVPLPMESSTENVYEILSDSIPADNGQMKEIMQKNLLQEIDLLHDTLRKKNEIIEDLKLFEEEKSTTSVEVQFDYWVPMEDLLHGACVVDEKIFYVQGSGEQSFDWNECGFFFHVPEGALLGTETCSVAVKALVAGNFKFPDNTQLISGLYAISAAREFRKPVRTIIQHCLKVERMNLMSRMKFIKAHQTHKGMPYIFSIEEGGEFEIGSQYGSFWQKSFSNTAIVLENQAQTHPIAVPSATVDNNTEAASNTNRENEEEGSEKVVDNPSLAFVANDDQQSKENQPAHLTRHSETQTELIAHEETASVGVDHEEDTLLYYALIFYERKARHRYVHKFVAVMSLPTHIKYVTSCSSFSSLEQADSFLFSFSSFLPDSRITLDFKHAQYDINGWHIRPLRSPLFITKKEIDLLGQKFQIQGQDDSQVYPTIPVCSTDVYADPGTTASLSYPVPISGIKPTLTMCIQRYIDDDQQGQSAVMSASVSQKQAVEKDQPIDYLEVFMRYSDNLPDMVTHPLQLANSLRAAGFISQKLADDVSSMRGVSNLENATKLFREVRNILEVLKKFPTQQREKMIKFCDVIAAQESPVLSILASQIRGDSGIVN